MSEEVPICEYGRRPEASGGAPPALTRPVDAADLQRRFGLPSLRAASALLRRMSHVKHGKRIWTTEEWLASWMAANVVPALDWPPRQAFYNPLEEAVVERTIKLLGELAARGVVRVVGVPAEICLESPTPA